MIFSENRFPLFGIMLFCWSMIFSENRFPLFGIMLKIPLRSFCCGKEPGFERSEGGRLDR